MVVALYCLILIPILIYLIFSVIEIYLTYRIAVHRHNRSLLFVQASTEVTHTLLVFAYAQFMIVYSGLLVYIGAVLWWPVALLMVSLLLRGSMYLLLFYRQHPPRWMYGVLLATYLVGLGAIVWGLWLVLNAIAVRSFMPDVSQMGLVFAVGMPALVVVMIPIVAVYSHALKQLRK